MKTRRLFIAVDLPKTEKKYIAKFYRQIPGIKWTKPEMHHLTLRFLGDTGEAEFDKIKKCLKNAEWQKFTVTIAETGFFPNRKRPKVFWLGLRENPALMALKAIIDQELGKLNIPGEDRKFSPHITLTRLRDRKVEKKAELLKAAFEKFGELTFTADKFILYSSKLNQAGAVHLPEEEYQATL